MENINENKDDRYIILVWNDDIDKIKIESDDNEIPIIFPCKFEVDTYSIEHNNFKIVNIDKEINI